MIQTPFFPMRPISSPKLTSANVLYEVSRMVAQGFLIQPKLNGDRGILEATQTGLKLWNRYGGVYSASSVNLADWSNLKPGTLLDGEIWRGEFYCFEEIIDGDTTDRIAAGRATTLLLGNKKWLFNPPTTQWLLDQARSPEIRTVRQWEGVVCKLHSAPYTPAHKPDQETPFWVKLKW